MEMRANDVVECCGLQRMGETPKVFYRDMQTDDGRDGKGAQRMGEKARSLIGETVTLNDVRNVIDLAHSLRKEAIQLRRWRKSCCEQVRPSRPFAFAMDEILE